MREEKTQDQCGGKGEGARAQNTPAQERLLAASFGQGIEAHLVSAGKCGAKIEDLIKDLKGLPLEGVGEIVARPVHGIQPLLHQDGQIFVHGGASCSGLA